MEQVNAFQMPVCVELATKLGPKLFRKTVLKTGIINYMGQQINFDTDMLNQYVDNFNAGAKDQVPFVLVDASNRHVDLPERYRGEIKGLEVSKDGKRLDAVLEMTGSGAKLIEDNPNLGVSIRAVDRLERPDGLTFGPTIEHVAGTLDPKINGLGPWIPVELSNPTANVIDLSGTDESTTTDEKKESLMASLTDEQVQKLLGLLEGSDEAPDKNKKNKKVTHSEADDDEDEQGLESDSATDDELEDVASSVDADEDENEDAPQLVSASNVDVEALELANARIDAQAVELARLRTEADRTRYESERQEMWSKFNLPPRIVDLARPLLEGSSNVVELSNGKKVDGGQVIRKVLHEFGTLMARLDLSNELGSSQENDEHSEAEKAKSREEFLKIAGAQLRGNTGSAARNGGN
jgi:hypothetical protein